MHALLVDLYDTLVRPDWWGLSERLCRGLGVTGEQLLAAFEATRHQRGSGQGGSVAGDLGKLAAACGLDRDEAQLKALAEDTVQHLQRTTHLFPDVLPTLQALRARGIRLALVSNCDHATGPLLEALGLDRAVDTAVLSCEVGFVKPDPRIYRECLERLGVEPAAAALVDDQPAFLDGAAALGIATWHIVREPGAPEAGPADGDPPRHRRIHSLADLLSK